MSYSEIAPEEALNNPTGKEMKQKKNITRESKSWLSK
jgi:hypothetical protein